LQYHPLYSIRRQYHNSLSNLLDDHHKIIIEKEKKLLFDLMKCLKRFNNDVSTENMNILTDLRTKIDDIFMVVIVGEFNAGL
jgi:hypothetical protein